MGDDGEEEGDGAEEGEGGRGLLLSLPTSPREAGLVVVSSM